MKAGLRRAMVWASAAMAVATAAGLVMLRSGRPLFYTDGTHEIHARELVDASMMVWQSPVPVAELPGPVVGRVQTLEDGRLLYGRGRGSARSDLVVFDPRRPDIPPDVVIALMSRGHDLAPALAGEWLYFSSDRLGGAGGFDVYRARYRHGRFSDVERLPDTINSTLDDSDPAPQPDASRLVFVRRDPSLAAGSNGRLMIAEVDAGDDAVPLFDNEPLDPPIERDPAFAPDGVGLWFVRQAFGERPVIARSWRHGEQFAPPVAVAFEPRGLLRAPDPIDGGFGLHLLRPATDEAPAMLYRALAREVYPWWPAQAWLELLLLSAFLVSLLLLLLLLLGSRWRQLDVITWCLILSLVAHLLLMVWLTDVEIVRKFFPSDTEGGLEVLLAGAEAASDGGTGVPQAQPDLSLDVRFQGHSRDIAVQAPASEVADVGRAASPAAERADLAELAPSVLPPAAATVADAAIVEARSAHDRVPGLVAKPTAMQQGRALVGAEHSAAESSELAATAPAAAAAAATRQPAAAKSVRTPAPLQPRRAASGDVAFADAPTAAPSRTATGESVPVPASPTAVGETAQPVQLAAPARHGGVTAELPRPSGQTVASSLSTSTGVRTEMPSLRVERPAPRDVSPSAGVRDQVSVVPVATARESVPALVAGAVTAQPEAARIGSPHRSVAAAGRSASAATAIAVPATRVSRAGGGAVVQPRHAPAPHPIAAAATPDGVQLHDDVTTAMPVAAPATRGVDSPAAIRAVGPALGPAEATAVAVTRASAKAADTSRNGAIPTTRRSLARAGHRPATVTRDTAVAPRSRAASAPKLAVRDGVDPAPGTAAKSVVTPPGAGISAAVAPPQQREGGTDQALRTPSVRRDTGAAAIQLALPQSAVRRSRGGHAVGRARVPLPAPALGTAAPVVVVRDPAGGDRQPSAAGSGGERLVAPGVAIASGMELRPAQPGPPRPRRSPVAAGTGASTMDVRVPGSLLGRAPSDRLAPTSKAKVAAVPDLFANRFGPKKAQALERFGGSVETERAVARGLAYLASIQHRDGSWGRRSHNDPKYGEVWVGKTGLCLLAFLGAGHTPTSDTEYSDVARRAVDRLVAIQDLDSGAFGRTSSYSHGIATYALAECYGLTKRDSLREPIDAAVQWILANQSRSRDRRSGGGWGYFSAALRPEDGFSRTSITVWMVMALESAKLSGYAVSQAAIDAAGEFLRRSWDRRHGYFYYNQRRDRLQSDYPTLPGSTPASVFALLLLGDSAADPALKTGLEFTLRRKPDDYSPPTDDDFVRRAKGHVYFWYYGSLACFMAGGEVWDEWNAALKSVLPPAQSGDGSFRPIGPYAKMADDHDGDRSFTTAMCVLSLEVYYRYFTPLLRQR